MCEGGVKYFEREKKNNIVRTLFEPCRPGRHNGRVAFSVLVVVLKIMRFRKIFMGFVKPGRNSCEAHSFANPTAKN